MKGLLRDPLKAIVHESEQFRLLRMIAMDSKAEGQSPKPLRRLSRGQNEIVSQYLTKAFRESEGRISLLLPNL